MTLTPHLPRIRKLAGRYAASGVDSLDAFVSEGVVVALEKLPAYDPSRGASEWTYLMPWVAEAMRRHADSVVGRAPRRHVHGAEPAPLPVSVHALTSTSLIGEWSVRAGAHAVAEVSQEQRRERWRMWQMWHRRRPKPLERDLMRGQRSQVEIAATHGVTKQAVSDRNRRLRRLLERYHRDVGDERKTVRVCVAITNDDRHNAKKVGVSLTRIVRLAFEDPVTASGTTLTDTVRAGTWVPPDVFVGLRKEADRTGRSMSHLVRAKIRQLIRESAA